MVKVKICGITRMKDAKVAVESGAWALGFIFTRKSKRYVNPRKAKKIIDSLPPFVTPVGVFVNASVEEIKKIVFLTGIQAVQLHGEESPALCRKIKGPKVIKAIRVNKSYSASSVKRFNVDAFLFDAFHEREYGGTGKTFDWKILMKQRIASPVILSGGLNTRNVADAIGKIKPYAVDVSSGVESRPGIKDHKKVKAFLKKVQRIS